MAVISKVKWYGDTVVKMLDAQMKRRVMRAGLKLKLGVQRSLNVPFRGGGDSRRYGPKREGTPSVKGEPPRKDMGKLQQSIYGSSGGSGTGVYYDVGTSIVYGVYHELHGRSFLSVTAEAMESQIAAILKSG